MKLLSRAPTVFFGLLALLAFGCAAGVYRVKNSNMCDSVIDTQCSDQHADPNRIRLCGSAFANQADFAQEAKTYCPHAELRNCALQCCDVDCSVDAAAKEQAETPVPVPPPLPVVSGDEMPPAPPPPPPAVAPSPLPPATDVPAPPPPPPPPSAAPAPVTKTP